MLHWIDLLISQLGPARRTALVLVAVNLLPLLLVASGLWTLQQVMLLYWIENGVIGLWHLSKILVSGWPQFSLRLFLGVFFTVHYGGFFLVHGIFLMFFLKLPIKLGDGVLYSMWNALPGGLWPLVLALVCSHGYSAYRFHFGHGLWRSVNSALLMTKPYGRVVLLHVTILVSGFLALRFGDGPAMLMLLVLMKTVLDVVMHVRSHRGDKTLPAAGVQAGKPIT